MAYRYPCNQTKSGFLLVFLSLWISIHSIAAFPNPISRIHRSEVVCVDVDGNVNDSSGHGRPRYLFCRSDHRLRKQQHDRRRDLTFRLWSSTGVDESDESNDYDLPNSKAKASPAGILATGYRRYLDLCRRRPFLTSSITAGILAASGDALSQSIQAGHGLFLSSTTAVTTASFNWVRWRTFLLTGLLFEGPWVSFWFQGLWRLGRWMEASKYQASSRLQVLVQTVIDQTIGVSIFFPLYFLVYEIIGAVVSGRGMYYIIRVLFEHYVGLETTHACYCTNPN
jgi:hypothetical protein